MIEWWNDEIVKLRTKVDDSYVCHSLLRPWKRMVSRRVALGSSGWELSFSAKLHRNSDWRRSQREEDKSYLLITGETKKGAPCYFFLNSTSFVSFSFFLFQRSCFSFLTNYDIKRRENQGWRRRDRRHWVGTSCFNEKRSIKRTLLYGVAVFSFSVSSPFSWNKCRIATSINKKK